MPTGPEDRIAGTLSRLPGGKLRFDYDEQYASGVTPTPLSLSMPVSRRSYPEQVITPWLWGLLPDDPAVLARWARHFGLSRTAPFTLLGTPVGADCAGAVRFARPDKTEQVLRRPGHITWITEDDVAELLRELRRDPANWLGRAFAGQFSLAGAQAKTALFCQRGRWGIPSGAAASELGIDAAQLVDRARELASAAPDAFADAAKSPDVADLGSDLPTRLTDLVAERAARCARLLGA